MDFSILAAAVALYKKIISFLFDYQSDTFGTGALGNVYIGPYTEPEGYEKIFVARNGTYKIPVSTLPHYNNLYIDEDVTVTTDTPYLFLYVKEKLTVKGHLTMSSKGNNSYNFSSFLAKPTVGTSLPKYTIACLKMFLSSREVRTTQDLIACGGNSNGTTTGYIALSGGGKNGAGGGLVSIYHKEGGLTYVNKSSIHANGGKTGLVGGGMLFVSARNIEVGGFGSISSDGGDGLGCISYVDDVPRDYDYNGNPNTNSAWGGGGVVVHTPLRVM